MFSISISLFVSFVVGVAHDDLKAFLESNIPTGKKKSKVVLGVADSKMGGSIQERVNIQCETGDAVPEILRGIRFHFHKMIEGNSQLFLILYVCLYFALIFYI